MSLPPGTRLGPYEVLAPTSLRLSYESVIDRQIVG